jgi:LmbE family N-acetylglucosaminyl deacetylase
MMKQVQARPSVMAIAAHPDDIEFLMAGAMLLLKERGWNLHYFNISSGNCGSSVSNAAQTRSIRLAEGKLAAKSLGAKFHAPVCDDLEIVYSVPLLRKIAAAVRSANPAIVLTHSPQDYMEDHMSACRLAVSAAFARGMPNFHSSPRRPAVPGEVTIYHAMPHGLRDGLRRKVRAGLYVDTSSVQHIKREALAQHQSQKNWLDQTQGMGSYLDAMDEMAREVGKLSKKFELAEGWRRHSHLGFCAADADPLREALGPLCRVDRVYEQMLEN